MTKNIKEAVVKSQLSTVLHKLLRGLPEEHCVGQGCVAVAIPAVDGGPVLQEVLDHLQVALTRSDVQRCASVEVAQTQDTPLVHTPDKPRLPLVFWSNDEDRMMM